jgi:GTPase
MSSPIIAIVGRANVGKSTLFNKLTQSRSAIVNDTPGVTRDRIYGSADMGSRSALIVDTGGVDVDQSNPIELQVVEQGKWARDEADCVIIVVDNQEGLTPYDREMVDEIRKSGKPYVLAVNKIDSPSHHHILPEFNKLGMKQLLPVSAEHGHGLYELIETVSELLPDCVEPEADSDAIRIAVIGKPNVGKSSLINKLLNSKRCIVSNVPGTTRDSIDSFLQANGQDFVLVDTAGIRRKGKTKKILDKFSVIMALRALDRCDVAILLLDSVEMVTDQDATIAGYAMDRGKACVIIGNKWDLTREKEINFEEFEDKVRYRLKFMEFAPILTVSAKSGMRVDKILPQAEKVFAEYSRRISTGPLNDCFEKAIQKNPMSSYRGKFLKMFYATQINSKPPTFKCFLNFPEAIHFSYKRYLVNSIRKTFGLMGTPIRLILSGKKEP